MQGKLNVMLLWSLKHVRNVIGSFVYSCFNLIQRITSYNWKHTWINYMTTYFKTCIFYVWRKQWNTDNQLDISVQTTFLIRNVVTNNYTGTCRKLCIHISSQTSGDIHQTKTNTLHGLKLSQWHHRCELANLVYSIVVNKARQLPDHRTKQ